MPYKGGDGSGRSGEKNLGAEVTGVSTGDGVCVDLPLGLSSYHSAGAFQEAVRETLSFESGGKSTDGGVGVLARSESARSQGAGVSGRALSVSVGFGGAVWTNDLKERTGRSIPSREADEIFLCLKWARIWPSWPPFMPLSSGAV